jgi:hypothetical protein
MTQTAFRSELMAQVADALEPTDLAELTLSLQAPDLDARLRDGLQRHGAMLLTDCYSAADLRQIQTLMLQLEDAAGTDDPTCIWQDGALWAMWNLFDKSAELMRRCLRTEPFTAVVRAVGEPQVFARATMMKKVPGRKQVIGWHQDLATAVDRHLGDAASVGVRAGVPHRDISEALYRRMVNVRINIEPQHSDGGCLQIIPGTHRLKLTAAETFELAPTLQPLLCPTPAGSLLIYHPMLMHSSGPNTRGRPDEQRRVIHTEFRPLHSTPGDGCQWYDWQHQAVIDTHCIAFTP